MKRLTWDLSGMGGGYERMCQIMLKRGIDYLQKVNPPVEMWQKATEYKNIYGVMATEGADLKSLESAILKKGEDCTGAMHQCVMNHLRFIHRNGFEAWFEEIKKARPDERPYELELEDP